ncbi:MAG TPA: protein-glutamine glutaminase family protein [Bacteriovoracaceae bacterium]|nr:protein-glutamine glutaminase family protein [Bacteriovoracaceae bacterium]
MGEEALVLLTNGKVATLRDFDGATLSKFQTGKDFGTWYRISLNEQREIVDSEEIEAPLETTDVVSALQIKNLNQIFTPSILNSIEQAKTFFNETKYNTKDSQCYMRAHVWAYDWRTQKNLFSSKVWLFFTRKYIRTRKFEWWFHVAPFVHVVVDGKVRERVLDIKYFKHRGPVSMKQWTDFFLADDFNCPVVANFSEQANHPETGSCYLMKSSMYFYQPIDLETLETKGAFRKNWVEAEVKQSYKEAFDLDL